MRGEQVDYTGETMKGVGKLGMPPAPPPQVLLAALAPAMLGLAGRLADGTVTWMVGPKTLKGFTSPTITAAAEKAGRSEAPRIVAGFPVSVSDDAAGSKERAARTFAMYDTLPSYKNMLDREGYGGPADIAIVGDEDAVAEQVLALAQCGVTEALCSVFGSREEKARTRALLARLVGQAA